MRNKIGFGHSFVVDCKGLSGSLAFLWKDNRRIFLDCNTHKHISLRVIEQGNYQGGLMAEIFSRLSTSQGVAWFYVEDFNEILHHSEKHGVAIRPYRQLWLSRVVVKECSLSDPGSYGNM